MSSVKKRPPLGKGLSALLENASTDITSKSNAGTANTVSELPISSIEANPFNPRTNFEKSALEELEQSIRIHGIIQPLTVRKLGRDKYQLISGERRFRASQLAGLESVPAYVRVANDQTMLEMALVENIQREDLNAIEVALSYQRLIEECDLTQDQLSQKISKSRSSITNHLRLLKLPAPVQAGVRDSLISMGHARALVSAGSEEEQIDLFHQTVEHQLSVRDLEQLVKGELPMPSKEKAGAKPTGKKAEITADQFTFREYLSDKLATKVEISKSAAGGGKISLNFNSENDLNRLIELITK
ncbi:MAG: ParB/RepB/Spo0J family partition protein [Crocinitomicaceae bacterium]|jgi:ParB family chromosome partitioning protein|nr:ParB/RepB/Spo0J family partition protein [Crocinitomicaceae bacterium]